MIFLSRYVLKIVCFFLDAEVEAHFVDAVTQEAVQSVILVVLALFLTVVTTIGQTIAHRYCNIIISRYRLPAITEADCCRYPQLRHLFRNTYSNNNSNKTISTISRRDRSDMADIIISSNSSTMAIHIYYHPTGTLCLFIYIYIYWPNVVVVVCHAVVVIWTTANASLIICVSRKYLIKMPIHAFIVNKYTKWVRYKSHNLNKPNNVQAVIFTYKNFYKKLL